MRYVYAKNVETGKEQYQTTCSNIKEAIKTIRKLYNRDAKNRVFENMFYYYLRQH